MRRAPSRTSASRSTFSASCSGSSEATILNMRRTSLGRPSAVPGPQQPGGYAALLTPAPIHNFRLYLRGWCFSHNLNTPEEVNAVLQRSKDPGGSVVLDRENGRSG